MVNSFQGFFAFSKCFKPHEMLLTPTFTQMNSFECHNEDLQFFYLAVHQSSNGKFGVTVSLLD